MSLSPVNQLILALMFAGKELTDEQYNQIEKTPDTWPEDLREELAPFMPEWQSGEPWN